MRFNKYRKDDEHIQLPHGLINHAKQFRRCLFHRRMLPDLLDFYIKMGTVLFSKNGDWLVFP
jgi:hypothetical protein